PTQEWKRRKNQESDSDFSATFFFLLLFFPLPPSSPIFRPKNSPDVPAARHFLSASPPKTADAPSSSSIRRSWLYLAIRSEREALPVLIWRKLVATAMSAIVESSVSPERWLITAV